MEAERFEISVEKPLILVWVGNPIQVIEQGKMAKGEFFIQAPLGIRKMERNYLCTYMSGKERKRLLKPVLYNLMQNKTKKASPGAMVLS